MQKESRGRRQRKKNREVRPKKASPRSHPQHHATFIWSAARVTGQAKGQPVDGICSPLGAVKLHPTAEVLPATAQAEESLGLVRGELGIVHLLLVGGGGQFSPLLGRFARHDKKTEISDEAKATR